MSVLVFKSFDPFIVNKFFPAENESPKSDTTKYSERYEVSSISTVRFNKLYLVPLFRLPCIGSVSINRY